ncbi:MAG TPA: phospholipase D-like domain-containing protein [Gemmatimonadales bacterium]|nr:phospholipase D-like domain-containing protein [Gemmatimonadales bacterium]
MTATKSVQPHVVAPEAGTIGKAIDRAADARPILANDARLLIDGPECYAAMLEIIARAKHWIHFENYIIRSDQTGWRFAEALAARAREGVRVRVIYDWLGSFATRSKYWKFLRESGVEVHCHNPPKFLDAFQNLNRDHRKLVVADGLVGITGGLCIGDEWMGDDSKGIHPWRDTGIEIAGPAAVALDQSFNTLWRITGSSSGEDRSPDPIPERGDASIRVIAGRPGRERTYKVLEILAASTIKRLWITDAYMVPPPRLFQAFVDAARDGVDIRMLVPGSSDVSLVRNLTRVGYRDLLRAGVRIFEWDGPMLHAKTIVADGCWARIGTSNLNASSLTGNFELDVLIEDSRLAHQLEEQFRRDISRSSEIIRGKLRAPQSFQKVLPSALARQRPEEAPPEHTRTRREARRRAVVALWTVVTGARRSLFGPAALVLIALGGLFLVLPRVMAYGFGALCVWLAVAATREALRRRGG